MTDYMVTADSVTKSLPAAVKTQLAAEVVDPGSTVGAALAGQFGRALRPEQFGAVGDGVTDDSTAFASMLAEVTDGMAAIILEREYKVGRVALNAPRVLIQGNGGRIIDGGFDIGVSGGGSYADLNIVIRDVDFYSATPSSTDDAITAQWVIGIDIIGGTVDGYRAAFGVVEQLTDQNHHVSRVNINGLRCKNCEFVVHSPFTPSTTNSPLADMTVVNCPSLAVTDTHLYLEGVDGLVVNGNTMFMPGYVDASTTKRWNIYVDHGQEINIGVNQLFEAGYEGVWLRKVQRWSIGKTHVSYPGQRARSAGIRISDGGPNLDEHSYGHLDALVFFPSQHGVWIEGPTGHVFSTAVVRSPGDSSRYYGAAGSVQSDYFRAESTTRAIKVAGEFSGGTNARVTLRGVLSETVYGSDYASISPFGGVFGGNNWGTFQTGSYIGGARRRSTGAVNAFVQWYTELQPGIYTISLAHHKDTDCGIYSVAVDGIDRGTVDGYAATGAVAVSGVTGVSIPVGGRVLLTIQMKTKNASSSSYYGNLSAVDFVRTGADTSS